MSYQKYLETVLDTADEYHEIGNLLDRFTTLDATNREMRTLMRDRELSQESTHKELQVLPAAHAFAEGELWSREA